MGKQSKVILSIIAIIVAGSLGYVSWSSRSTSNEQNITNQPLIQPEQQKNQELDSQGVEVITSDIDTSDWQIYEGSSAYNDSIKFTIKIPQNWDFRYRLGTQWKKKNVIYSEDYGPQECFLILGVGGHGAKDYKIIEKTVLRINNYVTTKTLRRIDGGLLGVINFGDEDAPIIFEYYLAENLLDSNCEKDIMNIIYTFKRSKAS